MTTKKNSLSFNTKFHSVAATITADKTMFLPVLCLSVHLQAVSITIFLTSRLLFLSFSLAGRLWEGRGGTEGEVLTPPSAHSFDVPWARHNPWITPLELLRKLCSYLAAPGWVNVYQVQIYSSFKKYTNTKPQTHTQRTLKHSVALFTLFPCTTLS